LRFPHGLLHLDQHVESAPRLRHERDAVWQVVGHRAGIARRQYDADCGLEGVDGLGKLDTVHVTGQADVGKNHRKFASFSLVLNEVVEQRHEEEGEAEALAFDVAARRAFTARLVELDALAEQSARSKQ